MRKLQFQRSSLAKRLSIEKSLHTATHCTALPTCLLSKPALYLKLSIGDVKPLEILETSQFSIALAAPN